MKKVISIMLATLTILSAMTTPFYMPIKAAEETVLYVSSKGSDSNAGTSESQPKKTLQAAIKALNGKDGRIVLTSYTVIEKDACDLPDHGGRVTITAKNGDKVYSAGELYIADNLYLGGETVFEDLTMTFGGAAYIFCQGNNTVFGENITSKTTSYKSPSIFGGFNCNRSGATSAKCALPSFTLEVNSGTWNKVYCGNYRAGNSNLLITSSNPTVLTIGGGTFKGGISPVGNESRKANATLNISGGTFLCSIYGIAEASPTYGRSTSFTGDIDINITGGTFAGDISVAARDGEAAFTGNCNINLQGGDFSRVNSIVGASGTRLYRYGKSLATLTIGKGIDINAEQTGEILFTNNIAEFADPSVLYHDGWYYYTYAQTYLGKPAVWIRRAANFSDISASRPLLVWSEANNPADMTSFWAPQLVFFEGKFYIYATCAYDAGDSNTVPRKPVVLISKTNDPFDGFDYFGPMENIDPDIRSYLSPRFIEHNGKRYMINGGFFRAEDRVVGEKHFQSLFITEMESPTSFKGKAVKIAGATESWEVSNGGKCKILEGPFAYTAPDGTLYVIYAANETARDDYCTGLLRFDGGKNGDITDASLWYKYPQPIHKRRPALGIHSPGAAILVPSPDGKDLWLIYHAKLTQGTYTYDGRILFAQPFETDANGVPKSMTPPRLTTVLSYSKNTMPLSKKLGQFDKVIDKNLPDAPETSAPETTAPVTTVPVTTAPVTEPPITTTAAPETTVPVTEPPVTTAAAPETTIPVTEAPVTTSAAPETTVPATEAPDITTAAPETTAPVTEAPDITTAAPDTTATPDTTAPAAGESGCGSLLSTISAAITTAIAAIFVIKKKKD